MVPLNQQKHDMKHILVFAKVDVSDHAIKTYFWKNEGYDTECTRNFQPDILDGCPSILTPVFRDIADKALFPYPPIDLLQLMHGADGIACTLSATLHVCELVQRAFCHDN